MENKKTQKIKCTVYDCKHCNTDDEFCILPSIKICCCGDEEKKECTMCDSYKKR